MEQEKAEQEAREKARREADKEKKRKEAEKESQLISSELYSGDVRLEIESSAGFEHLEQFKKSLRAVENLRISLDSWSEQEGILLVVTLKERLPLGSILSQMPMVEQVYKKRKKLVVVLSG